jgi:hypothetical protein
VAAVFCILDEKFIIKELMTLLMFAWLMILQGSDFPPYFRPSVGRLRFIRYAKVDIAPAWQGNAAKYRTNRREKFTVMLGISCEKSIIAKISAAFFSIKTDFP